MGNQRTTREAKQELANYIRHKESRNQRMRAIDKNLPIVNNKGSRYIPEYMFSHEPSSKNT